MKFCWKKCFGKYRDAHDLLLLYHNQIRQVFQTNKRALNKTLEDIHLFEFLFQVPFINLIL